ncbi:RNA-binding S4 domain-containing protein [Rothia sp. AR01]|uniref:RNA-binding S4 domain-containing protein n=1 Tax=Rothia santali TaxID=2949643 RepID=A0A9X2HCB9_9MICC|nr:RNA-binding S4 domain-containing protein [Rothia santali]MCP3425097.1 RNA-binding S4 domain-containing protein [Rothia santali]
MSEQHRDTVEIRDESIRLGQLLKLAGLVEDGLQAREVVTEGYVTVNGETVTQRGRQVRPGDVVGFAGAEVEVVAAA